MNKKILCAVLILTVLAAGIFALRRGESQLPSAGAVLYISPSQIADPTLAPQATFAFNVSIYNVTNMVYCAFYLNYTPNIFRLVQVQKQQVKGQYPTLYYYADDSEGFILVKLNYTDPVTLPEANASLLTLTFKITDYGITPLHFDNVSLKDNNGYTIPVDTQDGLVAVVKRDIAVTGLSTSTSETYAGRDVNITLFVQNNGNVDEDFTTEIFASASSLTVLQILSLHPGETRGVTFAWNTSGFQPSMTPYTISAQAQVLPYEANTTNNVYVNGGVKLKIEGDVNGDGKVDINDLIAWDAALSTYNAQADINGDGAVDKQDGLLIILNYQSSL